ncbi:MAG: hypothetical protein AB7O59_05455 [Pirellulales bacterium]
MEHVDHRLGMFALSRACTACLLIVLAAAPAAAQAPAPPAPTVRKPAGSPTPKPSVTESATRAKTEARRTVELPGPSDAPRVVQVANSTARAPADYKSAHFEIHTDLAPKEARDLLGRLEAMLELVSKYWGQPLKGTIECYVVRDLNNWPADALDPVGRAKVAQDAGITLVETLNLGNEVVSAKAVVYAAAGRGTPQHEAVHAYCGQTFGRVGPLWYSEGMAELGNYWRANDSSVQCPDYVIQHLRRGQPKPLRMILGEEIDRPGKPAAATGDSWENYAWRWALCHFLEHNPNYSSRFRPLGLSFLNDLPVNFGDVYGPVLRELAFEYRFFVTHVERGYRVDLCRWVWDSDFQEPSDGPISVRVAARRGWQPSGALVSADQSYHYSAGGAWRLRADGANLTADGARDGAGRLEAIVLSNYRLSEPFPLGAQGTFTPPADGELYLRCHDEWHELTDNKGAMNVKIKSADQGPAVPRPTARAARTR